MEKERFIFQKRKKNLSNIRKFKYLNTFRFLETWDRFKYGMDMTKFLNYDPTKLEAVGMSDKDNDCDDKKKKKMKDRLRMRNR